jgi:hypothetical protein
MLCVICIDSIIFNDRVNVVTLNVVALNVVAPFLFDELAKQNDTQPNGLHCDSEHFGH